MNSREMAQHKNELQQWRMTFIKLQQTRINYNQSTMIHWMVSIHGDSYGPMTEQTTMSSVIFVVVPYI